MPEYGVPTSGLFWRQIAHTLGEGDSVTVDDIEIRTVGGELLETFHPTRWHVEGIDGRQFIVVDEWVSVVSAGDSDGDDDVPTDEQQRYMDALDSGLSDAEARAEGWPNG